MPFKGFHYQLPEYEAITPQTHQSYHFTTLNVRGEERFKGSLMTPLKLTEHLNRCLYDSISKKPETIKNYSDFLNNTTLKDRECLIYALYHVSYEEVRNYEEVCPYCEHKHQITVNISDTFNFNPYPKKDVLTKRVKVNLPKLKNVSVYVKQPTLNDEIVALKTLGSRPGSNIEVITKTLVIEKIEECVQDKGVNSKEPLMYTDKVDILDAYMEMPSKDRRAISEAYDENFGKYGIELKVKCVCPKCEETDDTNIDLVQQFFRVLYES